MSIAENIKNIKNIIEDDINLIAVSKTKPFKDIEEAYNAGIRNFGENKVQELSSKMEICKHKDIRWHLIGHLQRNKVKYIVGKVYLIHSLDSVRLLNEIEKQYKSNGEIANVLIQINIGRDGNKTGLLIEDLDELISLCEKCDNVKVKGLMAIIPIGDEKQCRKYFKEMKTLFDKLKRNTFKNIEMKYLSMGMTGDYKIAIEEGSNMVRIGEGVFGKRNYNINKEED
ncbi:YggS family pyridoxal phosphate-dependent enzyme [Clostridium rectalis]|uniref:YggS family pyridoxal phosphate-dependent enzyme n=1 Tax=Clostridium rectalis TaxID=2040295 RepID=UPI000F6306E0|nr:YggS family pyridoxal phosphate-dependent enzyme [Clostridium rectalis]